MKKRVTLFFLLLFPILVFSQRGYIKGRLTGNNEEKLIYASVMLMNASDTSLIRGTATDVEGEFILRNIATGNYIIHAFYSGYEKWYSSPIQITKENNQIDMGDIKLTVPSTLLGLAEVTATKPLFEMRHGTMTMNVEADPTATGDNVLELLKKMPSVIVDHEDNISIEGKSGVTILIDDKPTHLSGDDLTALLKSMPTDMVEKIEVMKNPSARYDAEGTAGVINIVTKKEKRLGINGSVQASIGYSKSLRHNEGFNLNARAGKFYLAASYSFNQRKSLRSNRSFNQYLRGADTVEYTTNENGSELWGNESRWMGHNFSFSADYYINKKNSIGISYRGNVGNNKSIGKSTRRIYNNGSLDSSYTTSSQSLNHSLNQTVSVNYKHSFDSTGKDLYINFLYSNNSGKNENENELRYYLYDKKDLYRIENRRSATDPRNTNVYTLRIDYEHPFNKNLKLDAGFKTGFVQNENDNVTYKDDVIWDELLNHFLYKESITALYAQLSATAGNNIDIRLGIRGEYTWLEGKQLITNQVNQQQYVNLFPSFSVGYRLPKNHNLDFFYRNSIYRPGYSNLNPFINVSDPYNWSSGNPYLKPQNSHNLSLNYSWNYKINAWVGYSYTSDSYTSMVFTDPETGIRLSSPENIGKSHSFNAGLSARFTVLKFWNMNYYLGGNYGKSIFDYRNEIVKREVFGNWFSFNQSFTFLKNYTIDISGHGSLPSQGVFGRTAGRINVNAGFRANLLKKTLTLRLSINDIFNNGRWKSDYTYPDGSTSRSESRWESRSVWLSVSYRFGKQNIQPRNRRNNGSEELDRMGNSE